MRPWKLAELNYAEVKRQRYEVAVLPFGCTEPHNLHLPYGTDTLEADLLAERCCEVAHAAGARVILLPTIPYGTVANQSECPLSINVDPSTLFAFVTDIIRSLEGHGIRKLLLFNLHGGNDFKPLLRELYGKTACHVFLTFWVNVVRDVYAEIFEHADDHAGEAETSLALAYFPEYVARDEQGGIAADDGAVRKTRFEAVNEGWVSITRPWHLLTTNAGAGYPHAASAEKGKRVADVIVERMSRFLIELSNAEIDKKFPF
jgi:creatinine amidohydrolase